MSEAKSNYLRWYRHYYINSNGVKIFKVSNKPWATYSKNKNYLKFISSEIIENETDRRIANALDRQVYG